MKNKLTHYEDGMLLAYSSFYRDNDKLLEKIESRINDFDYVINEQGILLAYEIFNVEKLTRVYEKDIYMVNFAFINVDRYINDAENVLFEKLIIELNKRIAKRKGYYIIRVPSNIPMLIEQINKYLDNKLFTGGTIHYAAKDIQPLIAKNDGIEFHKADKELIEIHRTEIESLAMKAFDSYFGQYHISHFTRDKAVKIYLNWTTEGLNSVDVDTLLALYNNKVVGFLTYESKGLCGELILSGVDDSFQGKGIYNRMEHLGCAEIVRNNKIAFTSTQFDNIAVQRAWIKIGLKPYYSFYLFHVNNVF